MAGRMIPIWKEREIRAEMPRYPDLSERELAETFGVAMKTIRRIKESPALRPREVPKPRKKLAVKKQCPECGGILNIWPCPLCRPWAYYYDDMTLETEMENCNAEKKAA